jgi:two-component system cell cycle response regulator
MSDDLNKTQKLGLMTPEEVSPRSSNRPSLIGWDDEESSTRTTDAAIAVALPSNPALQGTRAVLTVVSGPSTGRVFTVAEGGGETVIGRGKEAQVRIDDAGASRAHARFLETPDGSYVVEDMGSTNGTFVDGKRVERAELHSGDRIHIGPNVVISFAIVAAQAEHVAHQLYESSVRDPLTRTFNRRYLVERLASEFAYARRHKTHLAVILFDLDLFKRVNDTHGHLAGDELLREVAALVQRMVRAEDVFARFGGEEFVLLVRGIEHVNVGRFAERVRSAVERLEVKYEAMVLRVTISLGYASIGELPDDHRDADGLLGLSDERLYKAKTRGETGCAALDDGAESRFTSRPWPSTSSSCSTRRSPPPFRRTPKRRRRSAPSSR